MADQLNVKPLDHGKLAPSFSLESLDNQTVTRSQYRGKQAMLILFFQPTPEAFDLLKRIAQDKAEYDEVNAVVVAIGLAPRSALTPASDLPFHVLADPDCSAWKKYTGADRPGWAVFVLDLYGGVDGQRVVEWLDALPDAPTLLEWTRSAQFRCSI
jgi:peroxiredoxin